VLFGLRQADKPDQQEHRHENRPHGQPPGSKTNAHGHSGSILPGADGAHGDIELLSLLDLVDSTIANPDHPVGYIKHLVVMGGGDDRDTAFAA